MTLTQLRGTVRSAILDRVFPGYGKRVLRHAVSTLPVDEHYRFDIELRLLLGTDLVAAPMLDVGASSGVYSAALEAKVGPANLYLFEPLPEMAARLRRRFRRSHVLNVACSDREGRATMRVPLIDGGAVTTLASLHRHDEDRLTGERVVEVELTTLDSIVSRLGLDKVSFLKVDVEGHELAVLRGAGRVLADLRPLALVEIEARHHAFPLHVVFDEILQHGYHGYFIRPGSFELATVDQLDVARDQDMVNHRARAFLLYLNNFFFVPVERETAFVDAATEFLRRGGAR